MQTDTYFTSFDLFSYLLHSMKYNLCKNKEQGECIKVKNARNTKEMDEEIF